jgi:hypothetical protein
MSLPLSCVIWLHYWLKLDTARSTGGFITVGGWMSKIVPIPMQDQTTYTDGEGAYTYNSATVEDINIIDPATLSRIYLGSPTPTILSCQLATTTSYRTCTYRSSWVGLR